MGRSINLPFRISLFLLVLFFGVSLVRNLFASDSGQVITGEFFNYPKREISVIVTNEGYYPEKIVLFSGERVRFFVTSTQETPGCFLLKEKNLFLSATKGSLSEGEALFDRAGKYNFYCPSSNSKGEISVIERGRSKLILRNIASESSPNCGIQSDRSNNMDNLGGNDNRYDDKDGNKVNKTITPVNIWQPRDE